MSVYLVEEFEGEGGFSLPSILVRTGYIKALDRAHAFLQLKALIPKQFKVSKFGDFEFTSSTGGIKMTKLSHYGRK